ncbi:hypothetical protein V4V34_18570 [Lysinibacillus sphaericus]|uniref:hypothetical protein n=1 Tax=Lysinibacillus sphaericus TaxID=1421 RepID=UPI002FBD65DB
MKLNFDKWDNRSKGIQSNPGFKEVIKSLDNHLTFVWQLSDLIWANGYVNIFNHGNRHFMMRTELIDSTENTLKSIRTLIDYGHFSDVNVLVRKFRDDLFLYLYFLEVGNRYDNKSISKHENNCFDWIEGKLKDFKLTDILIFLMKNKEVEKVINRYNLRKVWDDIGMNLNNFVHANGLSYVRMNYANFNSKSIERILKDIKFKMEYIISIFVILIILIKPNLIAASDYVDALDLGIQPEMGSQYFVAPFIQNYLDEHIVNLNPEIKNFIKDSVYMDIN